jgi:hypothetical protein
MAGRGPSKFLRFDAQRAIRSAREAGLEPAAFDVIIRKDGSTTFRVYGAGASQATVAEQEAAVAEWDKAAEKAKAGEAKAKPKPTKRAHHGRAGNAADAKRTA